MLVGKGGTWGRDKSSLLGTDFDFNEDRRDDEVELAAGGGEVDLGGSGGGARVGRGGCFAGEGPRAKNSDSSS